MTILATAEGSEPCIDEIEIYAATSKLTQAQRQIKPISHTTSSAAKEPRNVALASAGGVASASSEYPDNTIHKIAHLNDGRHGNSHSWISRVGGSGTIIITWPEPATIDRVIWGRDREEVFRDRLPSRYKIETALDPDHWQLVASSDDRLPIGTSSSLSAGSSDFPERAPLLARQSILQARLSRLALTTRVYTGTFTQPGFTHLLIRGDPVRTGDQIAPATLAAVQPHVTLSAQSSEFDRRAMLARWIANPVNPLSSRVMVNRLWHYHFGRGIVATPAISASTAPLPLTLIFLTGSPRLTLTPAGASNRSTASS